MVIYSYILACNIAKIDKKIMLIRKMNIIHTTFRRKFYVKQILNCLLANLFRK